MGVWDVENLTAKKKLVKLEFQRRRNTLIMKLLEIKLKNYSKTADQISENNYNKAKEAGYFE